MHYPLSEEIGAPELFVGRKKEFAMLDEWIKLIPKRLGKSKALFSRKKGGKTSLVQRLFNQLWSENGPVIPIFFGIEDTSIWLPDFAIKYYQNFASQYISFVERKEIYVENPLKLEQILEYGKNKSIDIFGEDIKAILNYQSHENYDLMWDMACTAPKRFASVFNKRFLVIIDEFQFLSQYVTVDQQKRNSFESLPGSYHRLSESKTAPMLITGSYTHWLNTIIRDHLEGGRVTKHYFSPYLAPDEGLCAVKIYSEFYNVKTTKETQKQINTLCHCDPFFISCVIKSKYEEKNLQTTQGVINTVHYEISNRQSDMSRTWREYIDKTLSQINNIHAKRILLHLSKNPNQVWIPKELIDELHLDISEQDVLDRLRKLEKADLIEYGVADIEFQGLKDGTLHLILRSRYGREIDDFEPDIRVDFRKTINEMDTDLKKLKTEKNHLSGKYNALKGQVAEDQLARAFRRKKRFSLLELFQNAPDTQKLNIIDVRTNVIFQRPDGKNFEIDIVAESSCGRVVLVEVKNWKKKIGVNVVETFIEKVTVYGRQHTDKTVLPCIWSKKGFSGKAITMCQLHGIGMADDKSKTKE